MPPEAEQQLKLAIDNALLPTGQGHLLSSYLQVLIMSEGDSWIHKTAHDLGLLLRDPEGKPVAEAEALVRRFATRELRSVRDGVRDVEEYVWNATLDLVIMAAWGVAAGQIGAEHLPVRLGKGRANRRHTHSHETCARTTSSRRRWRLTRA